jgi:hypothetical protein
LPQNKTFRNKFALFGEGRLQCNLKTWGILWLKLWLVELACYRPCNLCGVSNTHSCCLYQESDKCVTWSWSGYPWHVLTTHVIIASDFDWNETAGKLRPSQLMSVVSSRVFSETALYEQFNLPG